MRRCAAEKLYPTTAEMRKVIEGDRLGMAFHIRGRSPATLVFLGAGLVIVSVGCGSSDADPAAGSSGSGNGGVSGASGANTQNGGALGKGGPANGGALASGGAGTGGVVAANGGAGGRGFTGGTTATGGVAGSAAGAAAGGITATGGAGGNAGGKSTGGNAGTAAAGGSTGTGGASGACSSPVTSTSTRPQLTSTDAAKYTIAKYLAQAGPLGSLTTDNWDPTAGLGNASSFTPSFTVAADGSGTHTTVQAALNAATGSARRYVLVKPGTYREAVSYSGSTPVTLYGANEDATQVVIVHNMSAAQGASQTFTAKSNGFQIMNLTLSNDFATPASGTNIQALALQTMADKIVLQNVRLHGFQDTLQLQAPNATTRVRVYIKDSFIEGDTDYIYGNATVAIEGSTIHYLSSRRGGSAGVILAPSTSVSNDLGFLIIRCNFTADSGAPANTNHLGRSWDTSSTTPTPNGQAVIRESTIGAYVNKAAPWTSAATSSRPYSASGNRFSEYCNSGPGAG